MVVVKVTLKQQYGRFPESFLVLKRLLVTAHCKRAHGTTGILGTRPSLEDTHWQLAVSRSPANGLADWPPGLGDDLHCKQKSTEVETPRELWQEHTHTHTRQ